MNPRADAERHARQETGQEADALNALEQAAPLSLKAVWSLGALSFAAIILSLTPLTYQLDDIKVTLQFALAPVVGGLLAVALICGHSRPIHGWVGLSLLAYVLLGLLSTLLADYRWLAWDQYGFELALMVAFATVAFTATTLDRFRNLCRFYVAVGCVTLVLGLFHFFGGVTWLFHALYPKGTPPPGGPSPLFGLLLTLDRNRQMLSTILNRDFYPAYLVMIVPVAAALLLDSRRPLARAFYALATFLFCFCIVLAESNDSNIALTAMFLQFVVLLTRSRYWTGIPRPVLTVWIVGGSVLVATILFFLRFYFAWIPRQFPFAIHSRSIIWSGALGIFFDPELPTALFLKRIILGCGPGGFMILLPRYQSPDFWRWAIAPITQFSHSQFFDLLSERGTLGTAAFAAFLGGIAWLLVREIRRQRNVGLSEHKGSPLLFQIALLTAIVGISLQNLTSPNIRWTACGFSYWFLVGLAAAAVRVGLPVERREAFDRAWALPAGLRPFAAGALLVAMILFEMIAIPFAICRFASAKYNNDGRTKVTHMGSLINQMRDMPPGEPLEKARRQALAFARAAEADLERSLQWLPAFISSYYLLGHVSTRHAALAVEPAEIVAARRRAIEAYNRLAAYAPDYAEIHVGYGLIYQHAYSDAKQPSDKERAIAHLEKAARSTSELRPHMLLAETLLLTGETERAKAVCWRILDMARTRPAGQSDVVQNALNRLLAEARLTNDAKQLAALYRRQMDEHPDDTSAFIELVETLRRLGRNLEALELCQTWIERNPLDPLPRNLAARILFDSGAGEQALRQIAAMQCIQDHSRGETAGPRAAGVSERIAELRNPRLEELWLRAGQIEEGLGRTSSALNCYQRSMAAAPGSRTAWRAREAFDSLGARIAPPTKR